MRLKSGLHLAYCTNVHPGEDWAETFHSLERHTMVVKERLGHPEPYGIGLRLSDLAARELSQTDRLEEFRRWLDRHGCYVFTINGFPFGRFHGARVKEQVYLPDWTTPERLNYTRLLFDLLARLLPDNVEGSVSTSPGSFKEFIHSSEQTAEIRANLWRCVEHLEDLYRKTGRSLHLGLEPEPFGLLENSAETAEFFDQLREEHPGDERLDARLGLTYDTCHFAVAFEEPAASLGRLRQHGIRISKIQVSNALKSPGTPAAYRQLQAFSDPVYLHQVAIRAADGSRTQFKDLDLALAQTPLVEGPVPAEWRLHFHVPLHSQPPGVFGTTADHTIEFLRLIANEPSICSHLEMETYTWAVLPEPLKTRDVADQLVAEYGWTLDHLAEWGITPVHRSA